MVTTRLISSGDPYFCLLPRCEALRTCRSGFPIATVMSGTFCVGIVLGTQGGILPQFKPLYCMGLGGPVGNGDQWFPWIHIDDITGIFLHALEDQSIEGVLNGVAPEKKTNKQFSDALAAELRRPAFFRVPAFALNFLYGSVRASMILEGQNVFPKRVIECGYNFKYPTLPAALRELV